jgi:hypothetical protein
MEEFAQFAMCMCQIDFLIIIRVIIFLVFNPFFEVIYGVPFMYG